MNDHDSITLNTSERATLIVALRQLRNRPVAVRSPLLNDEEIGELIDRLGAIGSGKETRDKQLELDLGRG